MASGFSLTVKALKASAVTMPVLSKLGNPLTHLAGRVKQTVEKPGPVVDERSRRLTRLRRPEVSRHRTAVARDVEDDCLGRDGQREA